MEGLARARRDVMRRRRQERLDDALAAAADETAVDETEAGGVGTADAAGGRNGAAGARKRRRGEGDGEDRDRRRGGSRVPTMRSGGGVPDGAGDDDGVRATIV